VVLAVLFFAFSPPRSVRTIEKSEGLFDDEMNIVRMSQEVTTCSRGGWLAVAGAAATTTFACASIRAWQGYVAVVLSAKLLVTHLASSR